MVSNHGDRCCPQDLGLWDPFQMAFLWLINGGDPNYLLSGMILQVHGILEIWRNMQDMSANMEKTMDPVVDTLMHRTCGFKMSLPTR